MMNRFRGLNMPRRTPGTALRAAIDTAVMPVPVFAGGHGPYPFLPDTGPGVSSASKSLARRRTCRVPAAAAAVATSRPA
ncbi:MAG TPA: hypothetical protein VKV80_02270 [Streptosporangiaceae bacterium]|nr:hypothetical protein [Streptosporangiaceae bacterium]